MGINNEDCLKINESIESKGFEYTFVHCGNFEQIKDEKFHCLRDHYIKALHDFEDYINSCGIDTYC